MVPYSPLRKVFLSGKYKSVDDFEEGNSKSYNPKFSEKNFNKNLEIVKKVEEIAKSKYVTTAQIALAWGISKDDDMFPLTGTKRIKYLKENIESINIKFKKDEIEQLDNLYKLVSGLRY